MDEFTHAFRLMSCSLILAWLLFLLTQHRHTVGFLLSALCFCFISYLCLPILVNFHSDPSATFSAAVLFSNLIPALVWVLAQRLGHDSYRIPIWFVFCTFIYIALMVIPNETLKLDSVLSQILFFYLPQCIKLALVIHVITVILLDSSTDLISQRRKLRLPVAITLASVVAVVVGVEISYGGDTSPLIELVGAILFWILAVLITLASLQLKTPLRDLLSEQSGEQTIVDVIPSSDPLAARLNKALTDDRCYSSHGLTLDQLAKQLSVPTYKLRSHINQTMQFRNFNQFLNSYRVNEATERLISQPNTPILTIALDVGFKSLSSFNSAFKSAHKLTPSEYRHQIGAKTENQSV